jgi:hypothetical protein
VLPESWDAATPHTTSWDDDSRADPTFVRQAWKTIFLVLRPNTLSIYKTDKEDKLRHQIYLSELTAVTLLKDPKQKRKNVFALFSPARNFHFQASSAKDAQEWVDVVRMGARIEEEEEEMFLASPIIRRQSYGMGSFFPSVPESDADRLASSSPEPEQSTIAQRATPARQPSHALESSGVSDFSDTEAARLGASLESLGLSPSSPPRPVLGPRNTSTASGAVGEQQHDPDRVIWQGWLWFLRSKGGVKQWKNSWAVLRPRNLILYKDGSEYAAQWIVPLGSVVNVVEMDALTRTKKYCFQIITEEKGYRFSAHDEEGLLQCLGAFKSLLQKRRELEARAAASVAGVTST